MSQQIVARIKAELEARGQQWRTNEDAFQITARVAWVLRDQGAMLIVKRPAQNGAVWNGVKYSHDAIAFPSGWIDCLVSAGPPSNENGPSWNGTGVDLTASLAAPFDLDAGTAEPPPPPPPDDGQPQASPDDLAAVLEALAAFTREAKALRDEHATRHAAVMDTLARIEATQARGLTIPYLGVARPGP